VFGFVSVCVIWRVGGGGTGVRLNLQHGSGAGVARCRPVVAVRSAWCHLSLSGVECGVVCGSGSTLASAPTLPFCRVHCNSRFVLDFGFGFLETVTMHSSAAAAPQRSINVLHAAISRSDVIIPFSCGAPPDRRLPPSSKISSNQSKLVKTKRD